MYKGKKVEKMTWQEFLTNCDFNGWLFMNGYIDYDDNPIFGRYIIDRWDIVRFLNQPDVGFDPVDYIVTWGTPVEITNWNSNTVFYLVFIWKHRTLRYEAYGSCFFSYEDAVKFVKTMEGDEYGKINRK